MKTGASLMLIGLLCIPSSWGNAPASAEQELIDFEHAWSAAVVRRDGAFLRKAFAEEYAYTGTDGIVTNKIQDIGEIVSGKVNLRSFKLSEMSVRIYGDTAVVTGLNHLVGSFQGIYIGGPHRFTDVMVKRDGRWQVVSSHASVASKGCKASTSIADDAGGETYDLSRYVPC